MSLPRHRKRDRLPIRLFIVVGLLGAVFAGAPASAPAVAATAADCATPGTDDKCEAWVATYRADDRPYDVVVGAGGRRIFTTGVDSTVAFDDAGNQLWDAPIPGEYGAGYAVAASPDGLRIYVAYYSVEQGVNKSGTVAYDARTGRLLWAASSPTGEFGGTDVVVSPDGARVVVLGLSCSGGGPESACPGLDYSYVTSSLAASTGGRQWTSHYDSGKQASGEIVDHDSPRELVLSRDGTRAFVTGLSATVAYDTASGATLWAVREQAGESFGVATSPNGSLVFVTGHGVSDRSWLGTFVTVAYNAATGGKVWATHLPVPAEPPGTPGSMAGFTPWPCCGSGPLQISPTGDRLFLTGRAAYYTADLGGRLDSDALTLAFDPSSGRIIWQARYRGAAPNPGVNPNTDERGLFLQVAPDGSRVYMTGLSYNPTDYALDNGPRDYATVAYNATDGAQRWVARYNSSAAAIDNSVPLGGLAISPDGTRLYALGSLGGAHNHLTPNGERAWGLAAYDTGAARATQPGAWSDAGSMLAPRVSHTATALGDGRVLVTGGCSTADHANEGVACPAHTSSAELYRPPVAPATKGSWSPVAPMSAPRSNHTATLLGGGQVLVVGGCALPTEAVPCPASPSAERFDPAAGAFVPALPMSSQRAHHSATLLPSGKVLVAGGADESEVTDTAELFDPATGWSATTAMSQSRYGHTATLLPSGRVMVAGGADGDGQPLATAELYDPANGSWSATTGSLVTPRYGHTATVLATGKVLLVGGCVAATPAASCPVSVSAELFDPIAGTSAATGSLQVARAVPVASALGDGRVLVAGGRGHSGDPLSSAEIYDPDTASWSFTDAMLEARAGSTFDLRGHTATGLSDGRILVVGGTPVTMTEVFAPPPTTVLGADLSLSMTDRPDPVKHNQTLTYTITISNAGPSAAADVVVTDSLPPSVKFVLAATTQGACTRSGTTLSCSINQMAPEATVTVTIVVKAGDPGLILNTASVASTTPDPNSANSSASAFTTVTK